MACIRDPISTISYCGGLIISPVGDWGERTELPFEAICDVGYAVSHLFRTDFASVFGPSSPEDALYEFVTKKYRRISLCFGYYSIWKSWAFEIYFLSYYIILK